MRHVIFCDIDNLKPVVCALTCAASTALFAAISTTAFAQGQPAPQLAPLQPKLPTQREIPVAPKSLPIQGDKLTSPMKPRFPVAKKGDIALESITYVEANITANDEVKISFRVNTKNVGNADASGVRVRCGTTVSTIDLGPSYVGAPWKSELMVPYGGVSNPGDTHVVPIVLMMPFSANKEFKRKWQKIICKLDFDKPGDDSVTSNNRLESRVQFPDDTALNFPQLPR